MLAAGAVGGLAGCQEQQGQQTDTEGTPTESPTVNSTPEPDVEYELLPEYSYISFTRSNNPQLYEEGVLYRQMMSQLGFRFEAEPLELGALVERLLNREWDFTNILWEGSPENLMPYSNLSRSFSKEYIAMGESNYSHWTHPDYEEALQEFVAATQDEEYAIELAHYMQEILALNQPIIWVSHPDSLAVVNTKSFDNWKPIPGTVAYSNRYTLENIERSGDQDFLVWGQVQTLDQFPTPMGISNQVGTYLKFLYMDHLVDYDENADLIGRAAENWEFIEPQVIQIELRDDMKWHDGEDVTAEDVKFTWDYITEHGYPDLASDIAVYESSEVVDEYTINISLKNPTIAFMAVPMYLVFILPQHVWQDVMENNPDLSHPREWDDPQMTIGSGPFELVEYDRGNRVVFEKFQDHYNADGYDFDRIIYKEYGTNATLLSDISRNSTTIAQALGPNSFNRAQGMQDVKATAIEDVGTRGLWINRINNSEEEQYRVGETNEPFNDVYVRHALAHAINSARVIEVVYQGYGTEATNYVSPANKKYYNPDVPTFEPDLDKARNLLVESGLRYDDRGRLMKPKDWTPRETYLSPGEIPSP